MRWTCLRLGWDGSAATRERCLTVVPECASPSTPSPAKSFMDWHVCLENECVSLLLTDVTRAFSDALFKQTPRLEIT